MFGYFDRLKERFWTLTGLTQLGRGGAAGGGSSVPAPEGVRHGQGSDSQ